MAIEVFEMYEIYFPPTDVQQTKAENNEKNEKKGKIDLFHWIFTDHQTIKLSHEMNRKPSILCSTKHE